MSGFARGRRPDRSFFAARRTDSRFRRRARLRPLTTYESFLLAVVNRKAQGALNRLP